MKDYILNFEGYWRNCKIFLGAGLNDSDIKLLFENYATTFHAFKNHYFVIPNNIYSDLEL